MPPTYPIQKRDSYYNTQFILGFVAGALTTAILVRLTWKH